MANWVTQGNNINANNDWLGTTNNQPLVIRTNSTERMRVTPNGDIIVARNLDVGPSPTDGIHSAASGSSIAVRGISDSGAAVVGYTNESIALGTGVVGFSSGTLGSPYGSCGVGVSGMCYSGIGVSGLSTSGYGVRGISDSGGGMRGSSFSGYGVEGISDSGNGVLGYSGSGYGVEGYSGSGYGVEGYSGAGIGVSGGSDNGPGVWGTSTSGSGVLGSSTSGVGVGGFSSNAPGVQGGSTSGPGVLGYSGSGYGVYGLRTDPAGVAGFFDGGVTVANGDLTVVNGNKPFKIDHPLDPQNKYLLHNAVESSERKNIYDGEARLDEDGEAWVELPEWFEALNGDFRYQFTAVGGSAPNLHVAEEVSENRFKIAGGEGGMKVCWQLTGSRKDPWAAANPFEVEQEKREEERGRYLDPSLYDAPEEQTVMVITIPAAGEEEQRPPQPSGIDFARLEEERLRQIDELRRLMEEQRQEMEELRRRVNWREEAPPEST